MTTCPTQHPAPFCWKRNLVCVWAAQLFSIMGFAFAMSFSAYYIQSLGVRGPDAIKLWTGIYEAAGPLAFAVMSPVWGRVADRYGRRLMLLRANFAAAAIIFAMGFVRNVGELLVLRVLQGVFTGSVAAALTLVAATTPKERHGVALGLLQSAVTVGWMAGSALGGILADRLGYAHTIRWGGALLLSSALIVLFLVREQFTPPLATAAKPRGGHFEGAMPILLLFLGVALARRFDATLVPLFVQDLNGGLLIGSATLMGQLTAWCSAAAAVSSVVFGWLVDRWRPAAVAAGAALCGGCLAALQYAVNGFFMLALLRTAMALCMGGLEPAFRVWLTRTTSESRRGQLMGYSVSATNLGWMVAALSSATLATVTGIRPIFLIEGVLLLGLLPLIAWVAMRSRSGGALPAP
jgi:DHA1 family multidrug resistance protein-like MFS transporter